MGASLISPSGKVLVRQARCCIQPGPDPLPMPVLVRQWAAHMDHGARPPPDEANRLRDPGGTGVESRAEADLAR
jgi:hypothetical protein